MRAPFYWHDMDYAPRRTIVAYRAVATLVVASFLFSVFCLIMGIVAACASAAP